MTEERPSSADSAGTTFSRRLRRLTMDRAPTSAPSASGTTATAKSRKQREDFREPTREEFERIMNRSISEDQFRTQFRKFAAVYAGYDLVYHTYRSDRSDPGFPDDILMHRSRRRVVIVEAKSEVGKLSIEQVAWLDAWATMRDLMESDTIRVYGAARPSDADQLYLALQGRDEAAGALHQWCMATDCERCQKDRSQAKIKRRSQPKKPKRRS